MNMKAVPLIAAAAILSAACQFTGFAESSTVTVNSMADLQKAVGDEANSGKIITTTNQKLSITSLISVTIPCTIDGFVFTDDGAIEAKLEGDLAVTNCTFKATKDVRTPVNLTVNGKVTVKGNLFTGIEGGYYNTIELSIVNGYNTATNSEISYNSFESAIQNNNISLYCIDDNAEIDINYNYFKKSANALRLSNPNNSDVKFNLIGNVYDETSEGSYAGFLILQDYSGEGAVQDFSKFKININNLIGPEGVTILDNSTNGQVYYVYDNQEYILTDKNQPEIKFSSCKQVSIGDTQYDTLTQAVAAANAGDTITLLDDIVLTDKLEIAENKTVVLDLSGYTISAIIPEYMIYNKGNLTVKGDGCIYNTACLKQGCGVFYNSGSLTIENGTFGKGNLDGTRGNIVRNTGTVVIKDGTFTCCDNYNHGGYAYPLANSAGTMTIENARISGGMNGCLAADGGTIIVNGGSYELSGDKSYHVFYCDKGNIEVNGGEFVKSGNDRAAVNPNDGKVEINAGSFSFDVFSYIGSESAVSENEDMYNAVRIGNAAPVTDGTYKSGLKSSGVYDQMTVTNKTYEGTTDKISIDYEITNGEKTEQRSYSYEGTFTNANIVFGLIVTDIPSEKTIGITIQ